MDKPETPKARPRAKAPPPEPCAPPTLGAATFPTHFARLFFGAITLLVLYYSYVVIQPYLIDIFLALVLFLTAKPLYHGLARLFRGWRTLASGVTCLLLLLIILLPLITLVSIIANQALEFSSSVSQGLTSGQIWQWVNVKLDAVKGYLSHLNLPVPAEQIKLEQIIQTVLTRASSFVYTNAKELLVGFTYFFLHLVLVLFVTFFMFLQGDEFIGEIKKLSPLEAVHNDELLQEMERTIKATLWGTVIVAFVQGTLGGVGFLIFGVPQAAFWGTVMVPAAVVPMVGSALIWVPAALYLMLTGHLAQAVGLLFWGIVIIGGIDNLLKPLLMRGARKTPSILILFSILGGISHFGMIGFILGPLILSFLISLLRIYQTTILLQVPAALPPEKQKPAAPKGDGS